MVINNRYKIYYEPGTIFNYKAYFSYLNAVGNHCVILPKIHYNPKAKDNNRFSKPDIEILVHILDDAVIETKKNEFIIPGMCDIDYIYHMFYKGEVSKEKNKYEKLKDANFLEYKKKYYTQLRENYYIRNSTYRRFQNDFYTHADDYTNTFNVIFNDFKSADVSEIIEKLDIENAEEKNKVISIIKKIESIKSPMPIYRTDEYNELIHINLKKTFNELSFDKFICHQSRDKDPYLFRYLSKNNKKTIWYDLAQLSEDDEKILVQAKMLAGIYLAEEISIFSTNAYADKLLFNIYSRKRMNDVGDGICFELAMCNLLKKKNFNLITFEENGNMEFTQLFKLIEESDKIHIDYETTLGEVEAMVKGANIESFL